MRSARTSAARRPLERTLEALPEAFRRGEADVDERLERRVRRRLAERLLEKRNGEVVVLELGEDEQSLGAQRTARPASRSVVIDRARVHSPAARCACAAASARRRRSSAWSPGVSRSACSASSAVSARAPRSLARVAASSSKRATSASGVSVESARCRARTHRLFGDLRDSCVNGPPLFAEIVVEDGRQQRMCEADHPALTLDDARGDGRVERVRGNARALSTDSDAVPTAAASASASRTAAGSTEILAPTTLRPSPGREAAGADRRPQGRTLASSNAKNGFPPDRS